MTRPGRNGGPDDMQLLMAERLVRVATLRDAEAFAELFDYYGPRLKALLMRGGASADLAEDLVQETMIAVWRKAELYTPERGLVSTWIFRIARNLRVDRLRRRGPQYFADIGEAVEASGENDPPAAEAAIALAEERRAVASALASLPSEQCEVISLSFIEGLTQSEIAARLRLPLGTVKSRIRLAYGKLRAELEALR